MLVPVECHRKHGNEQKYQIEIMKIATKGLAGVVAGALMVADKGQNTAVAVKHIGQNGQKSGDRKCDANYLAGEIALNRNKEKLGKHESNNTEKTQIASHKSVLGISCHAHEGISTAPQSRKKAHEGNCKRCGCVFFLHKIIKADD